MQTEHYTDVFDYITSQEANYKRPVPINDVWNWSMADHIKTSDLYNNSQLLRGKADFTPVKNITRPILNLQHRTEDIELKDVQIYVDDPDKYHLSFLVKKYHDDVFVQKNDLDTFFDELNVSRIDFGGGLSKSTLKGREVVPLQSIAFCDQTDMLSGPIGIKHYYSPDQLLEMGDRGWGSEANGATISLDTLITLSREEKKDNNTNNQVAQTPGRYIEVYEVHGNLPKMFFDKTDTSGKYETRLCICAFYQKKDSQEKQGVILYTALEKKSPFKLIKRDPVYGRALGFGGAEELFEPQVWVNYDMIRMQRMLDSASITILKASGTNSTTIAKRQNITDLDNNEIIDVGEGGDLSQVDTFPRNLRLFENSVAQWEAHAQQMGAANDSIMGQAPTAGTPFKLQELVTNESRGLHDYRRGQYAKHIEEIYRDDYIPKIQKKITEGFKFLSELSLEELTYVREAIVNNLAESRVKEIVLNGGIVTEEEREIFKQLITEQFKKKGNKHFLEALKGEFKDTPLAVKVVVAGKSKNLSAQVDKLVNVFRTIVANPAVLQNPAMAGLWNQIIEASGLNPVDFSGFTMQPEQGQPMLATALPSEMQSKPMMAGTQ